MYVCFLFLCTAFNAALLDTHKKNVCSFGRLGLKLLEASPLTSRIARFTNSRALCVFFYATAVMCHDPDAWCNGRMLSEQVFIDCREPVVRFCFITVLLIVTSARVVILRFLTCFSFYIVCLCWKNCILEDGTLCIPKLPSSVLYSDWFQMSVNWVYHVANVHLLIAAAPLHSMHTHTKKKIVVVIFGTAIMNKSCLVRSSWSLHQSVLFSIHLLFSAPSFMLAVASWYL